MSRAPSIPGRPSGWPAEPNGATATRSSEGAEPARPVTRSSRPPRKSISPWANQTSLSAYAVRSSTAARGNGQVSEVVAVPRSASVPAEARVLPEPPLVRAERPVVREERAHHWSDPPQRRSSPTPREAAVTPTAISQGAAPVPYFTVPPSVAAVAPVARASVETFTAPGTAPNAHAHATPAASMASTVIGASNVIERPAHTSAAERAPQERQSTPSKTPPRGLDTGRHSDRHSDPGELAENFFSKEHRQSPSDPLWDDSEDLSPRAMTHGSKRAMLITFWMLGVSLTAIAIFVIYNQWVMPAPAPLTGTVALDLPTPTAVAPTPSAVPAQPSTPSAPSTPAPAPQAVAPAPQVVAPTAVPTTDPSVAAVDPTLHEGEPEPPENDPVVVDEPAATPEALQRYDALLVEGATRKNRARIREIYEEAVSINPNGDAALSKLAYYFLNAGKNEEAREYAQRAVAANPKSSEGWIVLGAAREALRDREGAAEAYKQCATLAEGEFVNECKRLAR